VCVLGNRLNRMCMLFFVWYPQYPELDSLPGHPVASDPLFWRDVKHQPCKSLANDVAAHIFIWILIVLLSVYSIVFV